MIATAPRRRWPRDRPSVQVRLFDLPCLFAGKLHAILRRDWKSLVMGRDCYDFVWYLGGQIPCNVGHLRARMTQTGHWAQGRELDIAQPRQLLQQRFQEVDFDQARRDIGRSSATEPS